MMAIRVLGTRAPDQLRPFRKSLRARSDDRPELRADILVYANSDRTTRARLIRERMKHPIRVRRPV